MSVRSSVYTDRFFSAQREHARRSATVVVPLVLDLTTPRSIVDVGCGTGTWLAAFDELGVNDFLGVDGDYVDERALEIPPDRFVAHDLSQPLELGRRFDLVVSLEVAEHVPAESASTFVETLTKHGPIVLFSAAIPGQGGTNHVNEQWPAYWAALFADRHYVPVDALRRRLWHDDAVAPWYAQNALLYVASDELSRHANLARLHDPAERVPLALVHPKRYLEWVEWARAHVCE
jgi:SAM-dependent methyltransferase